MQENLNTNNTDILVSLTKGFTGLIPGIGSLVSEAIGDLIPNQRIDRITKFIKELDQRLSYLEKQHSDIKHRLYRPDNQYLLLIEDGFTQAAKVFSDKRRSYIANILIMGLSDNEININRYRYILNILAELNDEEIIWLRFYLNPTIDGDEEFREKYKNVLQTPRAYLNAPNEELANASIQNSYKEHLERLGLIASHIRIDNKTSMPKFNKFGKPEISYRSITHLGKLLLTNIGLLDE